MPRSLPWLTPIRTVTASHFDSIPRKTRYPDDHFNNEPGRWVILHIDMTTEIEYIYIDIVSSTSYVHSSGECCLDAGLLAHYKWLCCTHSISPKGLCCAPIHIYASNKTKGLVETG